MKRNKRVGMENEIKKGPWKAEEDEVLINHVNKYGPRDWSSIRSKGLLLRTGKSCRLRWVNKLRPNLKTGVKFSAEEERIVIELQAQFGNKWARIATYLPGRTDNDVKNFWSSRQKRLVRILQTPSNTTPSTKLLRCHNRPISAPPPLSHLMPPLQAPKFSAASTEESSTATARSQSSSSSLFLFDENPDMISMLPLPDLLDPNFEQDLLQLDFIPTIDDFQLSFPVSPPDFPQQSQEARELEAKLGSQDIFEEAFGHHVNVSEFCGNTAQLPFTQQQQQQQPPCFGPEVNYPNTVKNEIGIEFENPMAPDSFIFDDFPPDMFEPLPSPLEW